MRLLITAILPLMLLMSCVSTEYIEKPFVPDIYFPDFPVLEDYTRNGESVTVTNEWIKKLAEYKIRIEETEKTYNDIKALYEK